MTWKSSIIIVFGLLLVAVYSCKSQVTYSEATLAKQSEKINHFLTSNKSATPLIFEDILKKLDVKPITFHFIPETWGGNKVKNIALAFYTYKDYDYMEENKIKSHNIEIFFKDPIELKNVIDVYLKNKKVWTKDVYNYFKDMPIESVEAY